MSTAGQPAPRPPVVNPPTAGTPPISSGGKPAPTAAVKRPVGSAEEFARSKLRRSIYALLAAISVGAMIGRILAVNSVDTSRVIS